MRRSQERARVGPGDRKRPYFLGKMAFLLKKSGANDPDRTDDLLITSELLYQLSYVGV